MSQLVPWVDAVMGGGTIPPRFIYRLYLNVGNVN